MNNLQYNFYIKNDNKNPKIEYFENNNNLMNKKYLNIIDIEEFSGTKNKNRGVIIIKKKDGDKMELYSYDEEDYFGFIEVLDKFKVKKSFYF
jgi:hypothetical protein